MKAALLVLIFCLASLEASASLTSSTKNFGLGLMLGDAASVTGEYWTESRRVFDFGAGSTFWGSTWVYGDYLKHFSPWAPEQTVVPYFGGGIGLGLNRKSGDQPDPYFLVRIPLGVAWYAISVPVEVYFEITPAFSLSRGASGFMDAGVGARYFF